MRFQTIRSAFIYLCLFIAVPAFGTDAIWNLAGDGTWQSPTSWLPGVPDGNSSSATFGPIFPTDKSISVDVKQPVTIRGIERLGVSDVTLVGDSAITIGSEQDEGVLLSGRGGTLAIRNPLLVASPTFRLNASEGGSIAIDGAISSTNNVWRKLGDGVLTVTGEVAGTNFDFEVHSGDVMFGANANLLGLNIADGNFHANGQIRVADSIIATGGSLTLNRNGGMLEAPAIVKKGFGVHRVNNLGCVQSVIVEQGELALQNDQCDVAGRTTNVSIDSEYNASLRVLGANAYSIQLNNAKGTAAKGGLQLGDNDAIHNQIDLGDQTSIVYSDYGRSYAKITGNNLQLSGEQLTVLDGGIEIEGETRIGLPGEPGFKILQFSNAGQLLKSKEVILNSRTGLFLNSTGRNLPGASVRNNRVADDIPIRLRGGGFEVRGTDEFPTMESFGEIIVDTGHSFAVQGQRAGMTLGPLRREGRGTIEFLGSGDLISFESAPALHHGMIGPWAVFETIDFASYTRGKGTVLLDSVVTKKETFADATASDHVSVFGLAQLASDQTVQSVVSQAQVIELNGHTLNIESGGLLFFNTDAGTLRNGSLTAGGTSPDAELVMYNAEQAFSKAVVLAADIVDNDSGPVAVTVAKGGFRLSGNNSFSGPLHVFGDVEIVAPNSIPRNGLVSVVGGYFALPAGSTIEVDRFSLEQGGTLATVNNADENATIVANSVHADSGTIDISLRGPGDLTKTSFGTLTLEGDLSAMSGNIDVMQGVLLNRQRLSTHDSMGTGVITVHADGTFVHDTDPYVTASIHLRGGELATDVSVRADAAVFRGSLRIGDGARFITQRIRNRSPVDLAIDSHSIVDDGTEFTAIGAGTVDFRGVLQLDGSVRVGVADSRVAIRGSLLANSESATLDVVGDGGFELNADFVIPDDNSLQLLRNGQPMSVSIGDGKTLSGSGRLSNHVIIEENGHLSPGDVVGEISVNSLNLSPGASIIWQIADEADTVASDHIRITDTLMFAVEGDPMTVVLESFDLDGDLGPLTNVDFSQKQSWALASSSAIVGFDKNTFQIDASSVIAANPSAAGGSFDIRQSDSTIWLDYLVGGARGDFNGDGILDASDMNDLSNAVRNSEGLAEFDLNGDGVLSQADRAVWIEELANSYFGDSNLDGEFGTADFVSVFQAAEYEDQVDANSGWEEGDWNGDAEFDSSDLVFVFQSPGFERGPRNRAVLVPEGHAGYGLMLVLPWLARRRCETGHLNGGRRRDLGIRTWNRRLPARPTGDVK